MRQTQYIYIEYMAIIAFESIKLKSAIRFML